MTARQEPPFVLTTEESKELAQHPVSPDSQDALSPERFELRLAIAKKICQALMDNDPTMAPEFQRIYQECPMWGFYVNKDDDSLPRRCYGACVQEPGKASESVPALHMVTARLSWINDVVGGVPVSSVKRVDRWNADNIWIIEKCGAPGIFLDPLGFLIPVQEHAR